MYIYMVCKMTIYIYTQNYFQQLISNYGFLKQQSMTTMKARWQKGTYLKQVVDD
jgi:hypothetical protein